VRRATLAVAALLVAGAAAYAFTTWPMINEVETGKTPEYPDVQPRSYPQSEETVLKAARAVLERVPGFTFVAAGSGPGGSEIQAVYTTKLLRFKDDVTVRIKRQGGATRVGVRSKSRQGKGDLGQNARTIRRFLAELDAQLKR
jgi:uncharacterized protein (DUF1499 family)